jgi:hypothetical protein
VFAALRVGLTIMGMSSAGGQGAEASQPADTFLCSEHAAPNLAFGGGAGVNLDVGRRMAFLVQGRAAMYRGSSELVAACSPGVGSPVTLNANVGFAYYFGV